MATRPWIRAIRYAFRENAIDAEVLRDLTAEDLKELGVGPIGHRRRLLTAIASLRGDARGAVAEVGPTAAPEVSAEAERRHLTVMFCDLVGSTPLSTRFDPENLREIVGGYHRCVADTVDRLAGFVAKYMGDRVVVSFGYPEAHEDDELRRIEGIALFGLNRLDEGQNALKEALHIAQRQQAKSYDLRAATSLARLWGEQGRRGEARDLLAPLYGWFTEGFDTADPKDAKTLLDQLT